MRICKSLLLFLLSNCLFAADKNTGKQLYIQLGCSGCHGDRGANKLMDYPALVGRSSSFISNELNKYRNGIRHDPTMNAMAVGLSDKQMEDIAAYIANE